jgi:hypothetical protein
VSSFDYENPWRFDTILHVRARGHAKCEPLYLLRPLLRKMSVLSNFLSFVQISCAGSRIFSLCLLSLVVVHYYIETCRRAYIRTILGTLPSTRGLGRRASGSVRTGVISSRHPSVLFVLSRAPRSSLEYLYAHTPYYSTVNEIIYSKKHLQLSQ